MPDSTYQILGTFAGEDKIIAAYKNIEKTIKDVEAASKALQKASNLSPTVNQNQQKRIQGHKQEAAAIDKLIQQYHRYKNLLRESKDILVGKIEGFAPYVEGAEKLARAQMRFKSLGLTAKENAEAFALVDEIARQNKNTYAELTDELQNLHTAFGDLGHAMAFLPTAAKTEYIFSALFGKNPAETQENIRSTMRALEQMGAIRSTGPQDDKGVPTFSNKDMGRLQEYYDTVVKMQVMTKGIVSGQELQQFIAAAGVAGKQLSPEGLRNMTFIIQEMKGSRAGTGLASMFQAFRAFRQGAGGQRSFETMAELGLVRSKAELERLHLAEFTKEGRIKKLAPGAVPVADLLGEDPVQFALAVKTALEKYGDKVFGTGKGRKKFDITSVADVALALSQMTGSRTSMNELATMILQISQISKDNANVVKSMGQTDIDKMADDSPLGKLKKWENAVENFREKAGLPLIETLGSMAETFRPFLSLLQEHPKLAIWGIVGVKAAMGILEFASSLRQLQMANRIVKELSVSAGAVGPASQGLGRRIGSGIATGIGISLAAFAIEQYVSAWMDKAQNEIDRRKGKEAVKDIDAKLNSLSSQVFSGKITAAEASEQRRQLLEQRAQQATAALGTGQTGMLAPSNFAALVAAATHGEWGQMAHGSIPAFGSAPGNILSSFFGGPILMKTLASGWDSANPHKDLTASIAGMKFGTTDEMQRFLDNIRLSGQYTEKETEEINKATREAYPQFISAINHTVENQGFYNQAIIDGAQAVRDFAAALPSYAGGGDGGWGKSEPIVPQAAHAKGGLTRRDHVALMHRDEFIIPQNQAAAYFKEAVGSSGAGMPPVTVNVNAPVHAAPGTDTAAVQRAIFAGVMQGKEALERTLNTMMKDRQLGGNG